MRGLCLYSPCPLAVFIAAAMCAACDVRTSRDGPVVVRDSLGIQIVESASRMWAAGEGWSIETEPAVVIGVMDGEEAYQFDGIRGVGVTAGDEIVVASSGSAEIRVYDAAGRYIRSSGGRGEGPGEFVDLVSMTVRGDTVVVFDAALARLSYFDVSGPLLGTTQLEPTGDPIHPLQLYGVGGFLGDDVVMVATAYPADMRPEPMTYWDTLPTLRYGRNGRLLGRVGEPAGMDTYSTPERAGSTTFARLTSSDVAHGALYMTDGGDYEVRVYESAVVPARIVRVIQPRRPVTDAVLDEYFTSVVRAAESEEARSFWARYRETWSHGQTLPWVSALVVDRVGSVWVREYQHRFDPRPERWGVFDVDGAWLGTVEMPPHFTPYEIGSNYVLGVGRDEFGVEYVRRYRLDRGM